MGRLVDPSLQTSEEEGDMVSNTWASCLVEPSGNRQGRYEFSSAEAWRIERERLTWSDRSPWFEDDEGALFGLEPLIRCRQQGRKGSGAVQVLLLDPTISEPTRVASFLVATKKLLIWFLSVQ